MLADLDPAVAEITGFTRYGIEGDTITIVDRGGIATQLAEPGRAQRRRSSARSAVSPAEREVLVARGRSDGRTVIFVPEVKAERRHRHHPAARSVPRPPAAPTMRGVLQGYDRRYDRLVDWVTETEGAFDDRLLGELPVARPPDRADLRHRRPLAHR